MMLSAIFNKGKWDWKALVATINDERKVKERMAASRTDTIK